MIITIAIVLTTAFFTSIYFVLKNLSKEEENILRQRNSNIAEKSAALRATKTYVETIYRAKSNPYSEYMLVSHTESRGYPYHIGSPVSVVQERAQPQMRRTRDIKVRKELIKMRKFAPVDTSYDFLPN